jgi:hypothetical protein
MSDKKISELTTATTIHADDVSVLVSGGTDYKVAFSTLLQFLGSNLAFGANVSFGTTLPQNTTGKNGDVFINTASGAFAQKTSGAWTVVYTLPSTSSLTDSTVLYSLGTPASSTGNNNDTYIDTGSGVFYKKSAGSWNTVFSMQTGPQGPRGLAGTNGTNGTNGFSVLNGAINPSNLSTGVNGDFYINTSNYTLFGPKTAGIWGDGVSLVGAGIKSGGTAGQVLAKASTTNYDTQWVTPTSNTDEVTELPGAGNKYFTESRVLNSILSGVSFVISSAITASDSILQALGKLQAQIYLKANLSDLNIHISDQNNPHQVSLEQARTKNNILGGNINANNSTITNLRDATDRKEPLTKGQFDDVFNSVGRNRGALDCSSNPNYPASNSSDRWEVTVSGKIGGVSGIAVDVYDEIVCKTTSVAGNQATVGTNFYIVQGNLTRATETTTGFSQIATNIQAVAMTSDDTFLTPLKGAALVDQKKKIVNYQVFQVSVNEGMILMENSGQINSVLQSGCFGLKLKIGPAGIYPSGTQTYPFSYNALDVVYFTYNYTNLADARCVIKLKCQDN